MTSWIFLFLYTRQWRMKSLSQFISWFSFRKITKERNFRNSLFFPVSYLFLTYFLWLFPFFYNLTIPPFYTFLFSFPRFQLTEWKPRLKAWKIWRSNLKSNLEPSTRVRRWRFSEWVKRAGKESSSVDWRKRRSFY